VYFSMEHWTGYHVALDGRWQNTMIFYLARHLPLLNGRLALPEQLLHSQINIVASPVSFLVDPLEMHSLKPHWTTSRRGGYDS
jgi:hypothetical protein